MPNNSIAFSHNWNGKLCCKCFTTIRPRNDHKYQVGDTYQLLYKDQPIGPATCVALMHITLDQLPVSIGMMDTGYDLAEAKKIFLTMYKNKGFDWATQQFTIILLDRGTGFKMVYNPIDVNGETYKLFYKENEDKAGEVV